MRTTASAAGTALVHINAVNEASADAQASHRYQTLVRRPATGASATRSAIRRPAVNAAPGRGTGPEPWSRASAGGRSFGRGTCVATSKTPPVIV